MTILMSNINCYDADNGSGIMIVLMSMIILGALLEQVLYYKRNLKRIIRKKMFVRRMQRRKNKSMANPMNQNEDGQPFKNATLAKKR